VAAWAFTMGSLLLHISVPLVKSDLWVHYVHTGLCRHRLEQLGMRKVRAVASLLKLAPFSPYTS